MFKKTSALLRFRSKTLINALILLCFRSKTLKGTSFYCVFVHKHLKPLVLDEIHLKPWSGNFHIVVVIQNHGPENFIEMSILTGFKDC